MFGEHFENQYFFIDLRKPCTVPTLFTGNKNRDI